MCSYRDIIGRVVDLFLYGGFSSNGRATDCGSVGSGIVTHKSPNILKEIIIVFIIDIIWREELTME